MKRLLKFLAWVLLVVFGTSFFAKLVDSKKVNSAECNHVYGDGILLREATCDDYGFEQKVCDECGDEEIFLLQKLGHSWVMCGVTSATCKEDVIQYWECDICWVLKETVVPKSSEHTGDIVSGEYLQATDWEDGWEKYYCIECSQLVETKVFPATHHDQDDDGYCDDCGVSNPDYAP